MERNGSDAQRAAAFAEGLSRFIADSPSSYHAAERAASMLQEAGFERLEEREPWPQGPGARCTVRDGAVIAWRVPEGAEALTPFAIVGAHTDSPGFRLKPQPDRTAEGWRQLAVEVYGGPLLNSWLDRELRLAGRIALRDGSVRLVETGAVARIPQLAVHLDRAVNEGLALDRQRHTAPVLGDEEAPGALELLARAAGVEADRIAGWDVFLADAQPPARFGADGSLLAAPRLDDLVSVYGAVRALAAAAPEGVIPVVAAFDHEEVGSDSRSGAGGPFLGEVLERIRDGLGADAEQRRRALAASWLVSSDVGHSVHPNYPERHDSEARPLAGRGTILKTNAQQRYASDARGTALWHGVCEAAGAPVQDFVSRNTIPSGTTIGPISAARLGIPTVDVGIPILSMHSARELCSIRDAAWLADALGAFLTGRRPEGL